MNILPCINSTVKQYIMHIKLKHNIYTYYINTNKSGIAKKNYIIKKNILNQIIYNYIILTKYYIIL